MAWAENMDGVRGLDLANTVGLCCGAKIDVFLSGWVDYCLCEGCGG